MRALFAVAIAAMLAMPALAAGEPETVTVQSDQIAGIWRIPVPESIAIGTDGTHYGPRHDAYCRIGQKDSDLKEHCLGRGFRQDGDGNIEHGALHLAFGTMMIRVDLDAKLTSSTSFEGRFAFKFSGMPFTDPDPVVATKLTPSESAPDGAGEATVLTRVLAQLAAGALTEPHDEKAIEDSQEGEKLPSAAALKALGAVQDVFYVGETVKPGDEPAGQNDFAVYQVEFSNGELLCGLHTSADGVLDALQCA